MKAIKKLLQIIQEDVIGTGNRLIAVTWLFCLVGLVGLGFYLGSESMSFLGVADSREVQVNFEYPVEIRRTHVLPGQVVHRGDLLVELDQSELNSRIRLLRSQISKLQAEAKVREQLNLLVSNSAGGSEADPLNVDIHDLNEELQLLETQKRNLYVFAEVDGVVGAVNFKKGEMVPAFTSLLTLSPQNPSYVDGFVHESLHTRLEVGREVSVIPVASGGAALPGRIVSVGSRIIMMPLRLTIYPNQQVWGREVVVEIPPGNNLLLGEKVQIKPKRNFLPFNIGVTEMAKATPVQKPGVAGSLAAETDPREMRMPAQLSRRFDFEPSGAIYLSDIRKFLVISDDTDERKTASLFLVDRDGNVEDQVLFVPNVGEISDLESISQSGDFVYLMTSQSLNKKGKEKPERNLFVRARRTGLNFSAVEVLDFRGLLLGAIAGSSDTKMKEALRKADPQDVEIESHFVDQNTLTLGFKKGFGPQAEILLVVIQDVDQLFKTRSLKPSQISGKWVDFGRGPGSPHRLSDLIKVQGRMYATTVCTKEDCGGIWRLSETSGKIQVEEIKSFEGLKPEGLAYDPEDSSFFVTFDMKSRGAKFARVPLSVAAPEGVEKNNEKE